MKFTFRLFVIIIGLTACNTEGYFKTQKLKIDFEVVPEGCIPDGKNAYLISWKDTLGIKSGYNLISRPLELWCHIENIEKDTLGYYRGLSMPRNFTHFYTTDSIINVKFSIAFNFFTEVFSNEKKRKIFWEKHQIPVEFKPVQLNLEQQLRQKIEISLIEK